MRDKTDIKIYKNGTWLSMRGAKVWKSGAWRDFGAVFASGDWNRIQGTQATTTGNIRIAILHHVTPFAVVGFSYEIRYNGLSPIQGSKTGKILAEHPGGINLYDPVELNNSYPLVILISNITIGGLPASIGSDVLANLSLTWPLPYIFVASNPLTGISFRVSPEDFQNVEGQNIDLGIEFVLHP